MPLATSDSVTTNPALDGLIQDWLDALETEGTAGTTVARRRAQVTTLLTEAKVGTWQDLTAVDIRKVLDWRARRLDYNPTTYNLWLGSLQQFCRWVVRNGLADRDPLRPLRKRNGHVDRRRQRRALTEEECRVLLVTTHRSRRPCKMPGPERAWLYALMLNTGLRIGEVGRLRGADLCWTDCGAHVVVPPEVSKHRREDTIPLPRDFALAFRELALLAGSEPIFDLPANPSRVFKRDVADAGIARLDARGRTVDLHALRHTYVTNLVRTGAHPKVVQRLARHSTIALTMDVYSHVFTAESVRAVSGLPSLLPGLSALGQSSTNT